MNRELNTKKTWTENSIQRKYEQHTQWRETRTVNALYTKLSSFAIILKGKRELVALLFLSYGYLDAMNVLWRHGTVGWSELCDCGISWSCSLSFFSDDEKWRRNMDGWLHSLQTKGETFSRWEKVDCIQKSKNPANRIRTSDLRITVLITLQSSALPTELSRVVINFRLTEWQMGPCMRCPTMWYVRPAWSEPLLVAWIFYEC